MLQTVPVQYVGYRYWNTKLENVSTKPSVSDPGCLSSILNLDSFLSRIAEPQEQKRVGGKLSFCPTFLLEPKNFTIFETVTNIFKPIDEKFKYF
jgi:hypothetical protein